jgi:hypothetical protein
MSTRNKSHLCRPVANLVFRKVHSILASEFSTVYHVVSNLKNEKVQSEVALKMNLNIHSFYSVDEFVVCTDDL